MKSKTKVFTYLKYLVGIIIPLVLLIIYFNSVIGICKIPSGSMEATVMTNDTVLINRLAYHTRPVQYEDVIVIQKDDLFLLKRVIGLPGDEIILQDGNVYRNGILLEESYAIGDTSAVTNSTYVVPDQCVFLLGDNRQNSEDSRYWESPYLQQSAIVGRAFLAFGFRSGFHFTIL